MTLEQIVRNRAGKAGSSGAWRVTNEPSHTYDESGIVARVYSLWHYSTCMLTWADTGYGVDVLHMSTGHGSVSDQSGMNTAFRALGLDYYFSRKGGAEIHSPSENCSYISKEN